MSLNKLMHPRNPYKNKRPDFKALAVKYEEFRKHATQDVKGNVHLDFKKPECLRALSWALMKEDFGVNLNMPLDRLIPTIPLRLNYILWLEDLLGLGSSARVIDIGCGAACVYAIIGAKKNSWKFLVSEADAMNHSYAKKNITDNNLQDLIEVRKVEEDVMLAEVLTESDGQFDCCMCNPPFYGSNLEAWGMASTRSEERKEPHSVSTASPAESITPGGEVAFVKRLIADSLLLNNRVRIYTTMLGKKTSLLPLKEELRRNGITNYGETEFCQGRTMRWGLAWTFDSTITFPKAPSKLVKTGKEKPPLVYKVPRDLTAIHYTISDIGNRIMVILNELKILYEPESSSPDKLTLEMVAVKNTWSNQRKKRRQKILVEKKQEMPPVEKQGETAAEKIISDSDMKTNTNIVNPVNANDKQSLDLKTDCDTNEKPLKLSNVDSHADCITGKRKAADACDDCANQARTQSEDCDHMDTSIDDVQEYLFRCNLKLHKDADDILVELKWLDGENRELMHQVMQYFKNNLK